MSDCERIVEWVAMICQAYLIGSTLELVVTPGAGLAFGARDLADVERLAGDLIAESLACIGVKVPRRRKFFRIDIGSMEHVEDGKHDVTIQLDLARMFPGERTPEMLAMAEEIARGELLIARAESGRKE